MSEKENIVKQTAKELGMTYEELGEAIGVSKGTLMNASSTGKITAQLKKSLELIKIAEEHKKDKQTIENFKKLLNK